jgi:predicted HAD superfamily phosphohydrolase YqeG
LLNNKIYPFYFNTKFKAYYRQIHFLWTNIPVSCINQAKKSLKSNKMILLGSEIEVFPEPEREAHGTEISPDMIAHGAELLFHPEFTKTSLRLDKIQDLSAQQINQIRVTFRGIILGIDGTLIEHDGNELAPDVIEVLRKIRAKTNVCAMSNNTKPREALRQLGIPVVTHVPPMPDPAAFDVAVGLYLQNPGLTKGVVYNQQCVVIGSNFLTEGGCRRLGMDFIHVKPVRGSENTGYKLLRKAGESVAHAHDIARSASAHLHKSKKGA